MLSKNTILLRIEASLSAQCACSTKNGTFPMLVFTKKQIETNKQANLAAFDAKVTEALLKKYAPVADVQTTDLHDWVPKARRWAQDLGYSTEQHLFDLVEAQIVYSSDLSTDSEFLRIHRAKFFTNEEKCRRIRNTFISSEHE